MTRAGLADVMEPVAFWGCWIFMIAHYHIAGFLFGWAPGFVLAYAAIRWPVVTTVALVLWGLVTLSG